MSCNDLLTLDIFLSDCREIYRGGVTTDGVYRISPDGNCPFEVYCDMTGGGWTLVQRRHKGDVTFSRSWQDYVIGFGDKHGDHWLGLEKIHRLTQKGSQLKFELGRYNHPSVHAHYEAFKVNDAMSRYTMNVDKFGYSGTIKEMLSYHDGMRFSTFDRDNDRLGDSCSRLYGNSGWWFNGCYRLGNLNGVFGEQTKSGMSYWLDGHDVYLNTTLMKVMPMKGSC